MSQQDERNYQAQMAKVYNWLREYSLGHEGFRFKTAEKGEYLLQGRGDEENPPNMFYVEVFKRRENHSFVEFHFYLNANKDVITAVKFHIGWFLQKTKGLLEAYRELARRITQVDDNAKSCLVAVAQGVNEEELKNILFTWLDKHAVPFANVAEDCRFVGDQLPNGPHVDQLVGKGLLAINDGVLSVPDTAEFQVVQNTVHSKDNPDTFPDTQESSLVDTQNNTNPPPDNVALPFNRIVFGAPGTGKSHLLEVGRKKESNGTRLFPEANYERVTFYSTYSYAQFVGSYKPIMKGVGEQERIAYQFVPGPFLRMLVKAANDPDQNYLLIIEEINRANAAAVFGDMFQLLDRTEAGESEYPIGASEDVARYLNGDENGNHVLSLQGKKFLGIVKKVQEGIADDDLEPANWTPTGECKLKLPKNLYIWATMNSADQGVFPLDTAFKRRWSFQYIGIDEGENVAPQLQIRGYAWQTLRKFLNRLLVLNGVNEDKLMGPFFLKDEAEFDSKVLMYLWEDAARMCRRAVFGQIKTYSELCAAWAKDGIKIFDEAKFDDDELTNLRNSLNGQTEHA